MLVKGATGNKSILPWSIRQKRIGASRTDEHSPSLQGDWGGKFNYLAAYIWHWCADSILALHSVMFGKNCKAASAHYGGPIPVLLKRRSPGRQLRPMNPPGDPRSYHRWSVWRPMNSLGFEENISEWKYFRMKLIFTDIMCPFVLAP